jgi:hypothetical protein
VTTDQRAVAKQEIQKAEPAKRANQKANWRRYHKINT